MKLAVNLGLGAYIQACGIARARHKAGPRARADARRASEAPTASGWLPARSGVLAGEPADDHARHPHDAQGHHVGGRDRRPPACRCRCRRARSLAVGRGRAGRATGISASWRGSSASRWCRISNSLGVAWNQPERIVPLDRARRSCSVRRCQARARAPLRSGTESLFRRIWVVGTSVSSDENAWGLAENAVS